MAADLFDSLAADAPVEGGSSVFNFDTKVTYDGATVAAVRAKYEE